MSVLDAMASNVLWHRNPFGRVETSRNGMDGGETGRAEPEHQLPLTMVGRLSGTSTNCTNCRHRTN